MRTAITLLLLLLLIWIAGSSYVYVCKIRNDCRVSEAVSDTETTTAEATVVTDEALQAVPATTADTLQAEPAQPEIPVPPLHILYFDFNQSNCDITAENTAHFELIKQYLDANADREVKVTGHSDAIGPDWAKEKVSAMRAGFIKQKLTEAGIAADAVETASESDSKPAADNSTSEGRAKNRRTEILIQ
ncbi:MAG: OmpA family protein [Bacteroidales bacterium]|nr:OmpA family protein [Bacteroidales bacterium]